MEAFFFTWMSSCPGISGQDYFQHSLGFHALWRRSWLWPCGPASRQHPAALSCFSPAPHRLGYTVLQEAWTARQYCVPTLGLCSPHRSAVSTEYLGEFHLGSHGGMGMDSLGFPVREQEVSPFSYFFDLFHPFLVFVIRMLYIFILFYT